MDDFSGVEGGAARIKGEVKGFESVVGQKVLGPSRTMAPLKPEYLEKIDLPKEDDMTLEYWRNIIASLKGQEVPYVSTDQIMRQMRIVEASFESAKKDEVIRVDI